MDKQEAFKIVFEELKKCPLFTGKYDTKNGNPIFMHGIAAVMESIAYQIDEETGDIFSDMFIKNMIEEED